MTRKSCRSCLTTRVRQHLTAGLWIKMLSDRRGKQNPPVPQSPDRPPLTLRSVMLGQVRARWSCRSRAPLLLGLFEQPMTINPPAPASSINLLQTRQAASDQAPLLPLKWAAGKQALRGSATGREQRSRPAGSNVGLCCREPSFDIGLTGSIGFLMTGS